MKTLFALFLLILTVFALSGTSNAYFLDAPHNESNGMVCGTCHGMMDLTGTGEVLFGGWTVANGSWMDGMDPSKPGDLDATFRNAICNNCHGTVPADVVDTNNYEDGPDKALHNPSVTETEQCTDCHDPHFQGQLDWNLSDENKLYLAWGNFTSNPNTIGPFTTINFDGPYLPQAGYEDPTTWNSKGSHIDSTMATDNTRGLLLVPNTADPTETFEIVEVTGGNTIKVKGSMTGTLRGLTFGVFYGQSIKSYILNANGTGFKNIKFFVPDVIDSTYGGYVDQTPGAAPPLGICQVCHVNTLYWKEDGANQEHMAFTKCVGCHKVETGFEPFVHPVVSTTGGACEICHVAEVSPFIAPAGVDVAPGLTVPSPGEVHSRSLCSHCHDPITNGLVGSAQNHVAGFASDCMTCHGLFYHETNHANVNYDPVNDVAEVFSQQLGCAFCHQLSTGDQTSLDTWPGIVAEHDMRDGVLDGYGGCSTCHEYDGTNGNFNTEDPAIIVTEIVPGGASVRCGTCHIDDTIPPS